MNAPGERCSRCESPLEPGDLRCPICAQPHGAPPAERSAVEVQVQRCDGCGAAVEYDVAAGAPRCPFCGATTHVETIEDPMERAEGYLPFTVPREAAESTLRHWLGGLGWFRPGDLKSASTLESVQPLYWVGWLFDAEATVSWTADSSAGARRAAWAPHAGRCSERFEHLVVSASRGLSSEETRFLVGGVRPESAAAEPSGASSPRIERFEVPRSLARRRILEALEAVARQRVVERHLPRGRHRHLKTSLLLRGLVTRRLAFPAWVMAYRYRGRVHRAVICGQDSSLIRATAPWSFWRIAFAVTAGLAAVAALVALLAASQ